jgi:hypothetical protein
VSEEAGVKVTFTQTGDLTIHVEWADGSHSGEITCLSEEDMMMAIGRFVWWSLDEKSERHTD